MNAIALAVVPICTAAVLGVIPSATLRHWIASSAGLLVLLIACVLPWLIEAPLDGSAALVAPLIAALALADAIAARQRHRFGQSAAQIRLAAMLLALAPADPPLIWFALALASAASAAIPLPCIRDVARRLVPANAALGVALFGATALQAGSVLFGSLALLIGWGALVVLDPVLLPLVLLLALRLQASVAMTPDASLVGILMVACGVGALLAGAVASLLHPAGRRLPTLLVLAQGGVALCAFGCGGPDLRLAGLLHLTLLTLSGCGMLLSRGPGFDHLAFLSCLGGLPPFGVFPGLGLILMGVAAVAPWLLLPLSAGLIGLGWSAIRHLPSLNGRPPPSIAWVPLGLVLVLDIAMPAQVAGWFHALAASPP
jgi:hypothetical protein